MLVGRGGGGGGAGVVTCYKNEAENARQLLLEALKTCGSMWNQLMGQCNNSNITVLHLTCRWLFC